MKNFTNIFKGINLTSIEVLYNNLSILLDKYKMSDGSINEYAVIVKNIQKKGFLDKASVQYIENNYSDILLLITSLDNDLLDPDLTTFIYKDKILFDEYYSIEELSSLIINHNRNVGLPSADQYLLEKGKLVKWIGYNTPVSSDSTITPLVGTVVESKTRSAHRIYTEWIIASAYLLKELNIWSQAKYYLENKNSKFSYKEFKPAYCYFILRQFKFGGTINSLDKENVYIRNFFDDDIAYRELSEDILYILLNLFLANKIIGNEALVSSLSNNDKFFDILKDLIEDHYSQNKEGYECLEKLRWYVVNNNLSEYQIKETFDWILLEETLINVSSKKKY